MSGKTTKHPVLTPELFLTWPPSRQSAWFRRKSYWIRVIEEEQKKNADEIASLKRQYHKYHQARVLDAEVKMYRKAGPTDRARIRRAWIPAPEYQWKHAERQEAGRRIAEFDKIDAEEREKKAAQASVEQDSISKLRRVLRDAQHSGDHRAEWLAHQKIAAAEAVATGHMHHGARWKAKDYDTRYVWNAEQKMLVCWAHGLDSSVRIGDQKPMNLAIFVPDMD